MNIINHKLNDTFKACALAALSISILWFFWMGLPIIIGKFHGNRELTLRTAVLLNNPNMLENRPMSIFERQHSSIEPDYHFLYSFDHAAEKNLGTFLKPALYDPNRLLGVPVWGSLITDHFNIFNLFFKNLPYGYFIAIKCLIYFIIASTGTTYLCKTLDINSLLGPSIAGIFYSSTTYLFFFIHWQGAMGVISFAPWTIAFIINFLKKSEIKYLYCIFFSTVIILSMNMIQITAYLYLFIVLIIIVWISIIYKSINLFKKINILLIIFITILSGFIFLFGALYDIIFNAINSSRKKFEFIPFIYPYINTPNVKTIFSDFMLAIPDFIVFDSWLRPTVLLPFIFTTVAGIYYINRFLHNYEKKFLNIICLFTFIYFFFGWIDRPFYDLIGKIYAPNPMVKRNFFIFYITISILICYGIDYFSKNKVREITKFFLYSIILLFLYVYINTFINDSEIGVWLVPKESIMFHGSQKWMLGFHLMIICCLLASYFLVSNFSNSFNKKFLTIFFLICSLLGLGMIRIPQNSKTAHEITQNSPLLNNFTRSTRLAPYIPYDQISWPILEMRFIHDAFLSHLGYRGFTGYHTTFSKQERKFYDLFLSEEYLKWRQSITPGVIDKNWTLFHCFLDNKCLLKNGQITALQISRLKLSGVKYIFPYPHTSNISEWDKPLLWPKIDLGTQSAAHLIENHTVSEVLNIFENNPSEEDVQKIEKNAKPIDISFDPKEQTYLFYLSGRPGTFLFAMNLRRNYECFIDGKKTDLGPHPDWPFWIFEVPEGTREILLAPNFYRIWLRIILFALAGLSLFGINLFFAYKHIKQSL